MSDSETTLRKEFKPRTSGELVIALISPVGTNIEGVRSALTAALQGADYEQIDYRLSDIFSGKFKGIQPVDRSSEFRRVWTSMEAGDELRRLTRRDDIMAMHAAAHINRERPVDTPHARRAHVLLTLKRPEEVQYLRNLYGPRFVLVSVFTPREQRIAELQRKGMKEADATKLVVRDEGDGSSHGQATSDAFQLADLFVDGLSGNLNGELLRFLDLLLGSPFYTPSKEEHGMFLAYATSLRSADLSRQVGAVIMTSDGVLVAEGCNDAPRFGGGPHWPGQHDQRDLRLGYDSNEQIKQQMLRTIVGAAEDAEAMKVIETRVEESGLVARGESGQAVPAELAKPAANIHQTVSAAMKKAIEAKVEESGLLDITEFGRAVHAEMAALMTCVRQGVSARNCTLFCTTFPCHNCAKHIIAAGISEVLFIEPYPKSRALSLHDDSLSMSCSLGKVILRPFVGVGPRRYPQLFALQGPYGERVRRKDSKGVRHWDRRGAFPSVHDRLVTYLELEDLAVAEFAAVVEQLTGPAPTTSGNNNASSAAAGDLTTAPGEDTRGCNGPTG